jgi:hypothetical protein
LEGREEMIEFDDSECCEHEGNEELWECRLIDEKNKVWQRRCLKCGETEEEALFVEYWRDKCIAIYGKQYRALKAWGNISVCSECGEVVWHPLILWDSEDTSKALTFHFGCARKIGILNILMKK